MPNQKTYVDSAGLSRFLDKLKYAYANGLTGFTVANATNATYATYAAGENTTIQDTYLKITTAAGTYAPLTSTVAGISLEEPITAAQLRTALNVADGAQVNVIEGVSLDGTTQTITNKIVTLDLSAYAKKEDYTAIMDFKGTVDYVSSLADVASPSKGDVWHVRYSGTEGTEPLNAEYVCTQTTPEVTWEELGSIVNFSGYATESWVSANFVGNATRTADLATINEKIETIYAPASGTPGDQDYEPESGVLVTKLAAETTRATTAENALDARLDVLEGDDTTAGSVAKSIKDALDALDTTAQSGDFVNEVTQTNGAVTYTKGVWSQLSSDTTAQTGATPASAYAVKQYVDNLVGGGLDKLDLATVGATGSYIKLVGQSDGLVSATAEAFDTTLGPASGTGAATDNTAPTSLAVRTAIDAVTVVDQNSAVITQMIPMSNSDIDNLFPTT